MIDAENRLRLPRWAVELLVLICVSGLTFSATHFVDNALAMQRFEDRLNALEIAIKDIRAEQVVNSNYRLQSSVKLENIERSVTENNQLLKQHEAESQKHR